VDTSRIANVEMIKGVGRWCSWMMEIRWGSSPKKITNN
jgi:hypothetical protein